MVIGLSLALLATPKPPPPPFNSDILDGCRSANLGILQTMSPSEIKSVIGGSRATLCESEWLNAV